ncbi:hypothetical protein IH992_13645 [Candidatus Poribacteria bacterium]|nr:hypothetical protein [Candidatus Poribacteria bacterium]
MKHNDLTGKLDGYDKEPKTGVDDLTEKQQKHINRRWEEFYLKHKGFLRRYAYGDEDLVSIGILSARSTLAEHPNCPESWLVHRAKLDINSARASDDRVYLSLDCDSDNDKQWVNDALQYQAMTRYEQDPEIIYHDQVKFNRLWDSLDGLEQKLLMILREEHITETRHRWYGGTYTHTHRSRPQPKKRFLAEVSQREVDWYLCFANVRYQFYSHFGTEEEIEREDRWYAGFNPSQGGLHHNRDARYDQKKKGSK